MAQAMVQRSRAKLRSAIEDGATKHWKLGVGDLRTMAELLEHIDQAEAAMECAEQDTLEAFSAESVARRWLKRVRKACYDITDMVDELQSMTAGEMTNKLLPGKKNRMAMASKMKEVKEEVVKIHVECPIEAGSRPLKWRKAIPEPTTSELKEDETKILGRDEFVERIMAAVLSSSGTEAPIIIIPIVGQQGIGKTSVARLVFRHAHFAQEYNFRLWVYVSPEYDLRRIANSIISQASAVSGGGGGDWLWKMKDITNRLHGLFTGMKVLIVLDDIWEQERLELVNLKHMLSSAAANSGKVVVIATTAIQDIATQICTGVPAPYNLHPLSDDMLLTIIKRESQFLPPPPSKRPEFEQLGLEIARSCRGLPAAARMAGRKLWGKYAGEWRKPLMLPTTPTPDPGDLFARFIVRCYADMPPSLKLCFTYCAVLFFPQGRGVAKHDMVHHWIALDLVQPSAGSCAAQVADEYIRRLIEMRFLRATSAPSSGKHDKGAHVFTMPDQVHGLAKFMMFDEWIVQDGASWQKQEDCRYAVLTDIGMKLPPSALPAQLRVLRCMGCSKMELSDDSFSFASGLRVLELKEISSMQKLPDSICDLRHMGYLNLSGCSRLLTLPESFGYLVNLLHVDLSGCSGLVKMPQSFGKLINLMHITFSGCSGLANLPESFGDLSKLSHVNLSRCCGLTNLPRSFQNLTSLVHLDLSFWSCFEVIQTVLGGLTGLQHLNLSHPCCYLAQHRSHLQGLKDVIGNLTKLRYLNLSMLLNSVFYYQSEDENQKYIQACISSLSSLEHLDLSHNIFLSDLPKCLGSLRKLHTLDLSGCIRLKRINIWMGEIECLRLSKCRGLESCLFVVHSDDSSSSLVQLEHVNCQDLEIRCLEKVKSTDEARMIMMAEKRKVERLKLCWTMGSQGSVDDNALLGGLQPPESLNCLELHGYNSETCTPSWWGKSACPLLHLVEVTMEDFPRCRSIPPLGMLPNLQKLLLRRMAGIRRIDLSGGNRTAFSRLSEFTIDDMENLQEFIMFPAADELVIRKCPELSFGPLPPRARMLLISDCNRVMASWHDKGGDHPTTSAPAVTQLVVESCHLPLSDWSLLHHLPGLHSLTIKNCPHLTTCSVEIIRALSSLQTLCFSHCDGVPDHLGELASLRELQLSDCTRFSQLPNSLGDLTSLEKLSIERCPAIASLPLKLASLKDLHILGCPRLKRWLELNRKKNVFPPP